MENITPNCQDYLDKILKPVTKYSDGTGEYVNLTDTATDYLHDYSIQGNTQTVGTPSLSVPASVKSVNGNVNVSVCNNNCFDYDSTYAPSEYNEFCTYSDGVLHAKGKNRLSEYSAFNYRNGFIQIRTMKCVDLFVPYVFSAKIEFVSNPANSPIWGLWCGHASNSTTYGAMKYDEKTGRYRCRFTPHLHSSDKDYVTLYLAACEIKMSEIQLCPEAVYDGYHPRTVASAALNLGSSELARVESGSFLQYDEIYRDNASKKWKMIKRTMKFSLPSAGPYAVVSAHTDGDATVIDKVSYAVSDGIGSAPVISNRFTSADSPDESGQCRYADNTITMNVSELAFSSVDAFREWLSSNDTFFIVPAASETVTELTEEESESLDVLPTYYPATTVFSSVASASAAPLINVKKFLLSEHNQRICFLLDHDKKLMLPVTRADLVYFDDGETLAEKMSEKLFV